MATRPQKQPLNPVIRKYNEEEIELSSWKDAGKGEAESRSGSHGAAGLNGLATSTIQVKTVIAKPSPPPFPEVPLLSLFSSLLAVDDSTLELLASHTDDVDYEKATLLSEGVHGVDKFILTLTEEIPFSRPSTDHDYDSPQYGFYLRMPNVLGIMTSLGGQLLRVIFRV